MTVTSTIVLFSLRSLLDFDILAWLLGVPMVIGLVMLMVWQRRQHHELNEEMAVLRQIHRHSIEYEMVIKAMKLCIWRMDSGTRTLTYDSDFREFGNNLVVPPGGTFNDVIALALPEYRHQLSEGVDKLAQGTIDDFHMQYQMSVPHSTQTYWSETFMTVEKRDINGRPLTIVGTTMRIDQQKEIEKALMDALYHAEESDRLKSAFLANISHEVRTPLNAIVGFSDVLPTVEDREEQKQLISLIRQNNAHLLRIFDDIVSMSKLEARSGEALSKSTFKVRDLLQELIVKYKSTADEKGLTLALADNLDDVTLTTDRDRLREILNQYTNNAMKFTTQGSVTLGCSAMGEEWRLWVRDTGKGIPADKCNDQIFERFVKIDEFVPGTGLGLSICRSMALTLGGTVGVESVYGEGSTFWVELGNK